MMSSSEETPFETLDPPEPNNQTPAPQQPAPPNLLPPGLPPPSALPAIASGGKRNPFSVSAGAPPPPPSAFAPPPPVPSAPAAPIPPTPAPLPPKEPTPPPKSQQAPPKPAQPALPVDPGLLGTSPLTATADEAPSPAKESERVSDGEEEGPGIFTWISANPFISKMAERAKHSVDSMITTLDPQMKEYLHASGSVEFAIASDQEVIIGAIKDGFQRAFSTVTARGMGSPGAGSLAATPLGHGNAANAARERIANLRASSLIPTGIPVVAVEEFVFQPETKGHELHACECLMMDDPGLGLNFCLYSATTPLSAAASANLKSHTPSDYAGSKSGFAITVGQAVAEETGCDPADWKETLLGYPKRQSLASACISLASLYKRKLPPPAPASE